MSTNGDMNIGIIKLDAIDSVLSNSIPDEGETIVVRGGLGGRSIYQYKKENGLFYQRAHDGEDWKEFDLMGQRLMIIQDMTSSLIREFDRSEKPSLRVRLRRLFKKILN